MVTQELALERNGQYHLDDLAVGIVSMKPSDEHPAARIGVRRLSTDETAQVVLRPGQPVAVLGHVLEALMIDRAGTPPLRIRVESGDHDVSTLLDQA